MTHLHKFILLLMNNPKYIVALDVLVLALLLVLANRKQFVFILKSLRRNPLRTTLTSLAVIVLVFVVTLIWTVLWFLNQIMSEKTADLKAIVTERWQIPSQMPWAYASSLEDGAASHPGDARPEDYMTWGFYGGTIDPTKMTRESIVFFFAMEPRKLLTMMDGLDQLTGKDRRDLELAIKEMERDKRKVIIGRERLQAMNKRVGERFKCTSMNYKEIDLEFEICGTFPDGRYNQSAVMNRDYLNDALDAYKRDHHGTPHALADKTLNLVWLRVPDTAAFRKVASQVENSSLYTAPAVKCETASSGISSFLDAYRDLLWGMRWLLVPAILCTMALVISNAISISVRERRTEMAVLKVLGFGPNQILAMVLGEALLIGCLAGLLSSGGMYLIVDYVLGGIKFTIAFFPAFFIPFDAIWWGPILGGATAFVGSILPAWSARTVKVSEVFSKIA
ncbi:MAG TPA: ABC transporter permease [Gemmataceae bacterium]|nr:ABC transporter permease [Gemmataceae bacterium]